MSRNYRINDNTISVYGTLTDAEMQIVKIEMANGKKLVAREKPVKAPIVRVKYSDIVNYFTNNEKNDKLIQELEQYKVDNKKKNNAATEMHVVGWFHKNYEAEYNKVSAFLKEEKK